MSLHHSTYRIAPLPVRVAPQPWEDLHSFLSRTAKQMQYERVNQVIQPEMSPFHIASSRVSLLAERDDYRFLGDLLLLSEETLYQMTLHRFWAPFAHLEYFPVLKIPSWRTGRTAYLTSKIAPHHDPIERPQLLRDLHRAFFHPNQTTQICPLCLQEEVAYDRLYWKARYLLTCHKHQLLLLPHCPRCFRRIPSQRLDPTSCPFCRHPYASTVTQRIAPEAMGLHSGDQLTLRALGVLPPLDSPSLPLDLNDPRALLPPKQYMALLRAFCISLHRLQPADIQSFLPTAFTDFLHTNQLFQRPYPDAVPPLQVAITHWIFTAWPDHFLAFLDVLTCWSWRTKKKHAFDNFPYRFLLGDVAKDALALVSHARQQYQPIYSSRALELRIQEHLDACNTTFPSSS